MRDAGGRGWGVGADDAVVRTGRRRTGRWVAVILAVPVVAVLVLGGLAASDAFALRDAAADLERHASAAQAALRERDVEALRNDVAGLEDAAGRFVAATDGPHWWLAARLPYVEDQARPLVAAGRAVEAVAAEALSPLAAMEDLDALAAPAFEGGRVDPFVLEPYRATLGRAADALEDAVAELAGEDVSRTDARIAGPYEKLALKLDEVAGTVRTASRTAELLPAMLGGEGPRTYLVMVQHNAEARATGGIAGAIVEIGVEDGRIDLRRHRTATEMIADAPVADLTADERLYYGERMAIFPQDVNFTPEFPRAAELMTAFWSAQGGGAVDGVMAVDPVALGWMLEGAPPVDVAGVTLAADTLAATLLNGAYLAFPDAGEQDLFFALAAATLFGQMTSGGASPVAGLTRAVEAGRFLLWAADPDEQLILAATPVAGVVLERDAALGLFVNDGSGTKIGWYVDTEATVTDLRCADGRLAGQRVDVALRHTFDGDVTTLPETVGGGRLLPQGRYESNLILMPPAGLTFGAVAQNGEPATLAQGAFEGRLQGQLRVGLEPGEAVAYSVELTAAVPLDAEAVVDVVATPGPRDRGVERREEAATSC
ncbi:DUF4012 domain-containing protein [Demequina pelophila]|uniref:DUF4012 domain-containing protein n=1 Tax=Demequina pelophila TaxID=1638984 RepID=UPI0012E0BBFE|nr:DUF4012 domain-containing protein [Demequina pelophila]